MPKLDAFVWAGLAIIIPSATFFALPRIPPLRTLPEPAAAIGSRFPASPITFERREIGPPVHLHPFITNVQIVDFDDNDKVVP